MTPESERVASPYPALLLGVVCVSFGSILVRVARAPALAVAFYRVALASLLLAPIALVPGLRLWPALGRLRLASLVGAGFALGLHFACWIASLSYTSVAASVLLVNTAPLFTVVFARVVLGETISPTVALAGGVALGGATLIALGDWVAGGSSLQGDLLALAGAATLSLYHVAGRGLRAALPLSPYVLGVWGVAAATLALLAFAARVPLAGYPPATLAVFLALAVVPTLAGHGLVNLSLRRLTAPTVGLFLLGEPVGASLLAYWLLDERIAPLTLLGGALVLAALAALMRGERP